MSFKITITPSNLEFIAEHGETILNAALNAGINLPHSCKNGACMSCKCKVASGEFSLDKYNKTALTAEETANGITLLCKTHAKSDITLDLPGFINGLPIKTLPSKIESIEKIGTVAILKLKLPVNQVFEYYAGQYIDIMYAGKNRSYSMASSPTLAGTIELHVRYREGGVFSKAVWNDLQEKQILRFVGPFGSFTLKDTNNPILMVCTGTGFAPVKAILEYMIATANQRQIHLVWGNYSIADFYLTELLDAWQEQLNLKITLCVNETEMVGYYTGLVTDYVAANFSDLSQYEVYACGNVAMIEDLYNIAASNLGLVKTNFLSDAFTPTT